MTSPNDKPAIMSKGVPYAKRDARHWLLDYWELARMHKFPAGSMVLFWPGAWGLTMAARSTSITPIFFLELLAVFFVGSTLTHCAACTINDICDIDFDRKVERCKNRPLASGRVSVFSAWLFLLLECGLCVALMSLGNTYAFRLGLIGLCPVHALYPLMKRITYWPQAYLGLAMNWGFLVGWVELQPDADFKSLVVAMLGMLCWTIVYDTIYALQDKKDDADAGVKSTALLFGSWVKPILAVFAAIFLGIMAYVGWINCQGVPYFTVGILGAAMHFVWQLRTLQVDDAADAMKKFLSNGDLGFIVWLGAAIDYGLNYVETL